MVALWAGRRRCRRTEHTPADRRRIGHQRQRGGRQAGQERPAGRDQGERSDARRHVLDDQGRLLPAGGVVRRTRTTASRRASTAPTTKKELPGGRKIDFSACQDDGSNPQTNLQIVQKLVQQDQVFAVVGISAAASTPSTDFMSKNQVPYYGWGFLPGFCGQRWGFGYNGCLVTNYPGKKHTVYQANLALGAIQAAEPHAQDHQGRAAGPGQRRRPQRQHHDQPALHARGCEGRLQRDQHPGPERGREHDAVRAGDQGGRTRTSCCRWSTSRPCPR